ncbi:transcriptional regulator, RpiR family [Actinacidiphila guanduensis]|uniref:Transcriptional regulator, RpiR family n=1 Tax=Actinacidiphila guanduensis TaxID=310781 RepID=A0A1H0EVC9_9ACTN|nr:transcriptional regulator, RpiR family [Actinacidiphila guanduensis]
MGGVDDGSGDVGDGAGPNTAPGSGAAAGHDGEQAGRRGRAGGGQGHGGPAPGARHGVRREGAAGGEWTGEGAAQGERTEGDERGDRVDQAGPGEHGGQGEGAGPGEHGGGSARLLKLFEAHRLTPTQRRIAHCLVRRADDAPFLSSVEVAELAGVSQPSVTRFAVALGFDGYPALRRHLREVAPAAGPPGAAALNEYQQAVQAEMENLRHLSELLADPAPVARAGAVLAASRPLPVLGLRAAGAQARGFAYFAAKVHPDVRLLEEGGTMLADRVDAAVRAGASALLCFALPRHPREVVDALGYARGAGLTVVTVADSAFAPVAAHSDLLLPAAVGTGLAFDTACAPMLLGRVLLESMCDALPEAQSRLEEFDAKAAARGLFAD